MKLTRNFDPGRTPRDGVSRRARRSWLLRGLVALTLLTVALPAHARDDDVEFALGLAGRGYYDLAEAEIDRMIAGSPTPQQKENAQYARAQLLRTAALQAASNDRVEPKDVRERFTAASAAFSAFLDGFQNSARRNEAEFNMAKLQQDFAYYLNKNLDKFEDPEAIRKEADAIFDEAIKFLTRIRDREHEKDKDKDWDDPERFFDRNIAWYQLIVAMHDRAMLKPAGDAIRVQQLTKAIDDETIPYLEETDGSIFGYFACMYLGLEYWHRAEQAGGEFVADDIRSAEEWFLSTVDAAKLEGIGEYPAYVNVIFQTTKYYGEMCNEVGTVGGVNYPSRFIAKIDMVEKALPTLPSDKIGMQVLIEGARSLAAAGNAGLAIATLSRITESTKTVDPSWGRAVDQLAKRALNEIITSIPPDADVDLSADILWKAAEGSLADRNWGSAIRVYQRVLLAVAKESDEKRRRALEAEYFCKSWLKINLCYSQLDRPREAFIAADQPVQAYLAAGRTDVDQAFGDAAYFRIVALQNLAQSTKDPAIEARLTEARELFTDKFGWSEKAGSTTYIVAVNKLNEASRLKSSGEDAASKAAFREAIELLGKVGEKDPRHRTAQSRIGEALVLMGEPQKALDHLRAFLKKWDEYFTDGNTPPRERQPQGWATFWMATAFSDLAQPAEVVTALSDYETRFEGATLESSFPRVRYLRLRGLLDAGRTKDAETAATALITDTPESSWSSAGALAVANTLYQEAAGQARDGDKVGAKATKERAVDLYDFWIDNATDVGADQFTFVGQMNLEVGRFERATAMWEKALQIYDKRGDDSAALDITVNLASVLIAQGKYAEARPKFETLFVKHPEDLTTLRATFEAMKLQPRGVDPSVYEKFVRDTLNAILDLAAKDPAGASAAATAKSAVAKADTEAIMRAFDNAGADGRLALARATAFTLLGENAMHADLRRAMFGLVKTAPGLMSGLARCYDELFNAEASYPARAVNLYSLLLATAPATTDRPRPEGSKYSEKWFEWKYQLANLYLKVGRLAQSDEQLRTVCAIMKSMGALEEFARADEERAGFSGEFKRLKDETENELRKMGKEGCK